MNELLAKSSHGDRPPITLLQHTIDVMNAAEWLFGRPAAPTRLGSTWLCFFKIPEERYPVFHVNLIAAAGFHDWGKANDGFQKMLRREGEDVIRHEHLGGLLLALDPVTDWLKRRPDLDPDLVLSAVLTHHLKINMTDFAAYRGGVTTLRLLVDHPDFPRLIGEVAARLGLPESLPKWAGSPFWAWKDRRGNLAHGVFDLEGHCDKVKARRLRPLELALREEDATADAHRRMLWAGARGFDRGRRRGIRLAARWRGHAALDRGDVRPVPPVRRTVRARRNHRKARGGNQAPGQCLSVE